jgi:uncharacterized protein YecA (UPF0149 family)
MMMNGDLVKKAIQTEPGTFLHTLATSNLKPQDKVQYLFEAAVARRPTTAELTLANQLLLARKGDTAAALADMFWALLNSNEFILQH